MTKRSLAAALIGFGLTAPLAAFAHVSPDHTLAVDGTAGFGLAAAALLCALSLWMHVRPRRLDTEAPAVRGQLRARRDRA